jgi:hypothetical protein
MKLSVQVRVGGRLLISIVSITSEKKGGIGKIGDHNQKNEKVG